LRLFLRDELTLALYFMMAGCAKRAGAEGEGR